MIFSYISDYFQQLNKPYLLVCSLFTALFIAGNFHWGWEKQWIYNLPTRAQRFGGFYLVYASAFLVPWVLYALFNREWKWSPELIALIVLAPAVFAFKSSAGGWQQIIETSWSGVQAKQINTLLNWPLRLIITVTLIWVLWSYFRLRTTEVAPFAESMGLKLEGVRWAPYWIMLAAAIPLVSFAATQADFLLTYPKLRGFLSLQPGGSSWWKAILFELCYGSDFLTIELFFRGFLVVFLSRWIGPAAILPMAVFYCSIHFGKPLLECISSYLGGILLGIFAYYSRSIFGGILVHLGLAWMMELAAWIALHWKR